MRFTQQEKYEIIKLVDQSDLSANRTLKELGIHRRTFYNWYKRYQENGYDGLAPEQPATVIDEALEHETLSSRELAFHIFDQHKWFISESSVYRILKRANLITAPAHIVLPASDEFNNKTRCINEMWQTDFTYFKIVGWGWYYLSTVMDDYSRYILSWDLCDGMTSDDVTPSVEEALNFCGLSKENAPKLLSDNGSCMCQLILKSSLKTKGLLQ